MAHANIFGPPPADLIYESKPSETSALSVEGLPTSKKTKGIALSPVLVALFLFCQMFDYHALKLFTVTPDRILFFLIALRFAWASQQGRLRSTSRSGQETCMLVFTILCTVSYCITNPDAGLEHYKWLTTLFNLIVFPFGIYVFAKNTRYTFAKTISLLWAIVCIGIYLAFTASFEHFGIKALVFPKYILDPHVGIQFGRARGPMVGSNPMGEWLVVVFLAVCLVTPFAGRFSKLLLHGLILMVTMGIYFTLTRGVWLSFAIVLVLTSLMGGRFGIQSRVIMIVVLVAFFAGAGSKFSYGGETLFSRRQNTVDYRMSNNKTTFNMGMANLMTGVGYGNFKSNWGKYFGSKEQELTRDLTDGNHNTYLGLFADLGLPGLALYVALFGYILKECIRIRKSFGTDFQFERNLALCTIGLVLITLWEAMSGDLRFNPTLNTVTFLFVGIVASMKSWRRECARTNVRVPGGQESREIRSE